MDALLTGGRPFLLVLAVLAAEAAVLVWLRLRARRADLLRRVLPSLVAAAGLSGAAWLALAGAPAPLVGCALLVALSAHVVDLLSLRVR